jgi:hypothetical protein
MQLPSLLCYLYLLAHGALAIRNDDLASYFGLTFSPTTIIASRINSSGSVELTKFPTSDEYKSYYKDAVQKLASPVDDIEQPQAQVQTMFRQAFTSVTESLKTQLGHEPHVASLFLSSAFASEVAWTVVEAVFTDPQHLYKRGLSQQATCNGYLFLECRNLGRVPADCTDGDPENLVLVLEYEREYLYLSLQQVLFELGTYYVHRERLCIECGEDNRQVSGTRNL